MPRMKSLDVVVKLTRTKGAMGYCLELDDNRTFEIEIDRTLTLRKMLETLAHEIVHVKQYVRNELGINDNNDGQDYYNLSYEKQAYELQETLSEQFIKECDYEMA